MVLKAAHLFLFLTSGQSLLLALLPSPFPLLSVASKFVHIQVNNEINAKALNNDDNEIRAYKVLNNKRLLPLMSLVATFPSLLLF